MTQAPVNLTGIPLLTHAKGNPRRTVRIAESDLLRGVYALGGTGTGKSALVEALFLGAVRAGWGGLLIDPHGDLAVRVLALLPRARWNDVVAFRPRHSRPVGLNVLSPSAKVEPGTVASTVTDVFRGLYGETLFGPRSAHVLRNAVLATIAHPAPTLLVLQRMLVDADFRRGIVARATDPLVRQFWRKEFPALGRMEAEVTAPILNKLGGLTTDLALRRVVGQARPRLDLREAMDRGRIVVADLSGLGRDTTTLLGGLLAGAATIAARSRAGLPLASRAPFLMACDEAQLYASSALAEAMNEGRKFGLAVACCHQGIGQLPEASRGALLAAAGTLVSFRVGAEDAETLAPEIGLGMEPRSLLALGRGRAALRLLVRGAPEPPTIAGLIPAERAGSVPETLLRISAEQWGRRLDSIDWEISRLVDAHARLPAPHPRRSFLRR